MSLAKVKVRRLLNYKFQFMQVSHLILDRIGIIVPQKAEMRA